MNLNESLSLASSLLELCWLYIQLFAFRSEIYLLSNLDQATGSALGLAGAYMLARNGHTAAWGWIAFLGSNVALIVFAMRNGHAFLLALQICFVVTSALGIWNYLVKPQLYWDEWRGDFDGNVVMVIKHLARWRCWRLDLHKMLAPDAPGCFHTHPAMAVRVILWGGYTEEIAREQLPCDLQLASYQPWIHVEYRRPGYIGRVKPELCHRIHALPRGVSYSLWLRWPKTHDIKLRGPGWPEGSEAA